MKWISVKDKMPDKSGQYCLIAAPKLNSNGSGEMEIRIDFCYQSKNEKTFIGPEYHPKATHWMPLPEPPKK